MRLGGRRNGDPGESICPDANGYPTAQVKASYHVAAYLEVGCVHSSDPENMEYVALMREAIAEMGAGAVRESPRLCEVLLRKPRRWSG